MPVERPVKVYDVAHGDCMLQVRGNDDTTSDPLMAWNNILVAGGVVGRVHASVACTSESCHWIWRSLIKAWRMDEQCLWCYVFGICFEWIWDKNLGVCNACDGEACDCGWEAARHERTRRHWSYLIEAVEVARVNFEHILSRRLQPRDLHASHHSHRNGCHLLFHSANKARLLWILQTETFRENSILILSWFIQLFPYSSTNYLWIELPSNRITIIMANEQ